VTRYIARIGALSLVLWMAGPAGAAAAQAAQEDDLASPKLRIAWAEFKKAYDDGKIVVIDVRGDASYEAGHIPGARSIAYDVVEQHAKELKKLKKPIVLYCA
jgi:3-mercaptopyruvate sulfurtransferase SseA